MSTDPKYPILIYTNNKTRVNDQWFLHNNQLQDIVNLLPPNTSFKNFVDHYTFVENNHELFQQGFLQIVTETVYDYPAIFYTEKTFKPIVNKRPFVMLGVAGSIKKLQDLEKLLADQSSENEEQGKFTKKERLLSKGV